MNKTDALFTLIKSLSKSEKRYFKLVTAFQGRQQKYLVLFEALDQLEQYDEGAIRKKVSENGFIKQLHVAKNYLSSLIMKSLRGYYLNSSLNAQLKSLLIDIEILFNRDLLKHCYQTINRADKLARKLGDELALLEVLSWKRKLLLNMKDVDNGNQTLSMIAAEEQNTLKHLKNESHYWALTLNVSNLDQSGIETYLNSPFIKDASHAKTYRSRILYHHLKYVTQTMAGDLIKAEESIDQLLDYLKSEQSRLRNDPGPYITALNNKIGLYLNQRKHQQVPPLLERIRTIPKQFKLRNSSISLKLMIRSYNVELEAYRDSGQVGRGIDLISTIRSFIDKNTALISTDYKILFHYQFAYLYFMAQDFRKALQDVNAVLRYRNHAERNDILGYAQFLNLLIHYELGNWTVIKYSVDASRRFLKKKGALLEFEKVLLRIFSKLSTNPEVNHQSILVAGYQNLFGEPPLLTESQLDYLNFKCWIESKIKNSS